MGCSCYISVTVVTRENSWNIDSVSHAMKLRRKCFNLGDKRGWPLEQTDSSYDKKFHEVASYWNCHKSYFMTVVAHHSVH